MVMSPNGCTSPNLGDTTITNRTIRRQDHMKQDIYKTGLLGDRTIRRQDHMKQDL